MEKFQKIIFQEKEYIIDSPKGGFIATEEQYINGIISFAHLCSDGIIRRYHKKIGTIDDIIFTNKFVELEPTDEAFEMVGNLNIYGES